MAYLAGAGWLAAAVLGWLLLGAREDIGEAIGQCNTEKLQSALESSELARTAEREAATRRFAELEALALSADRARRIAEQARLEAESRPVKVKEVIRNVPRETLAQQCLDMPIDAAILGCLRNAEDC